MTSGRGAAQAGATRQIISVVAAHYGVSVEQIMSQSRKRVFARPRQVAMYLVRDLTGRSYPWIGGAFGRDHSTVVQNVALVDRLRQTDSAIAADVAALTCALARRDAA